MSQSPVGYLNRLDENGFETGPSYQINPDEEYFIGRNRQSCRIVVNAPWISNRQMRLYSINYDEEITPFLYAEDLSSQGNNTWLYRRHHHWEQISMSKGSIMLLCFGDRLRLCDGTVFSYRSTRANQLAATPLEDDDDIRGLEKDSFDNLFHITQRQLGAGGTATVYMAVDRWNKKQVACKIVTLKNSGSDASSSHHFQNGKDTGVAGIAATSWADKSAKSLRKEVDMLKTLNHPNVIQLQRVFYTKHTLYLIEDLVTGGDLTSYIDQERKSKGAVDGEDACGVVYQIVMALNYFHGKGVVHRDIKPENVLLSVPRAGARVILTDFGGAAGGLKARPRRLNTYCGTADWLAPEVARGSPGGYTKAVDMWSLGCLVTALFAGSSIFADDGDDNNRMSTAIIKSRAAKCDLSALDSDEIWHDVHQGAKDLIRELLVLDENKRLTADKALLHDWFRSGHPDSEGFYKTVTADWKPSPPVQKIFEEDLKVFIQAGISVDDERRRLLSYAPPSTLMEMTSTTTHPTKTPTDTAQSRSKPLSQPSQTLACRNSSFIEAPEEFNFVSPRSNGNSQPSLKRKSTINTNPEDHALRTKAWAGNRGLMLANDFARKIAETKKGAGPLGYTSSPKKLPSI